MRLGSEQAAANLEASASTMAQISTTVQQTAATMEQLTHGELHNDVRMTWGKAPIVRRLASSTLLDGMPWPCTESPLKRTPVARSK